MKTSLVAILVTITVASVAPAQILHVTVERAVSSTDQLEIAKKYAREALQAKTSADRMMAAANASANFQATRQRATKDRNLFVNAALLEADMYLALDAPMSAKVLLEGIQRDYAEGPGAASVQLRLGRALHRLHMDVEAENALKRAEERAKVDGPTVEFAATKDLADLYSRRGKHTEAAAAYRKLYRKLADDPTHRAYFALQSARASVGAGDLTGARDDADAADGFIQQARGRSKDPSEARTYLQLSDDIKRFRDRNKLH